MLGSLGNVKVIDFGSAKDLQNPKAKERKGYFILDKYTLILYIYIITLFYITLDILYVIYYIVCFIFCDIRGAI